MKLFIASDIHGSAKYCRQMLEAFEREGADKLVLLGDILYHGPRNPLPEEYSPAEVVEMLSAVKQKILCVRGNCDAEIDLSLLPFPVTDYTAVCTDGVNIYFSHGHRDVPAFSSDDVYITGHTHISFNVLESPGYYHLNPGSVSLPKEESARGYILYENRKFSFKTLEGEYYDGLELPGALGNKVIRRNPVIHRKIVRRAR